MNGVQVFHGVATFVGGDPCPGCGTAYLTMTVDPMHPHNPAECVAFKRGYEAGQAMAAARISELEDHIDYDAARADIDNSCGRNSAAVAVAHEIEARRGREWDGTLTARQRGGR